MNRDVRNLQFILTCIARMESYTAAGRASLQSQLHVDAIERNLEKLADTTKQLSDTVRASDDTIPWRAIGDFRNILAHRYHGVDYDIVWSIVTDDLPVLKRFAERTLAQLSSSPDETGAEESPSSSM